MQEFILYSQVLAARHGQVLNILAGVTASQPAKLSEQTVIYQQLKTAETAGVKKGQTKQAPQSQRLNYVKLVRDLIQDTGVGKWRLRAEEVPEPGLKSAISRHVSERDSNEAELERFGPESGWYRCVAQFTASGTYRLYCLYKWSPPLVNSSCTPYTPYVRELTTMNTGSQFVHGNVVLRITRIFSIAQLPLEVPVNPPAAEDLDLLDRSGTYLVEAFVRTEDGSSSTIRDKATKELLDFAETVKGAIDFRVPDRLALDPRVKGS